MKKILIRIQNNQLYFSYKRDKAIREDLMNTNIISDSELVFSDDYITENQKLVIPFFKELCLINNIDTLVFQNIELATLIVDLYKDIKIRTIRLKKEEPLTHTLSEKLLSLKHLKEIQCYTLPNYLLDLLDKHHITVHTTNEIFYISNFMLTNKLTNYSDLFYKRRIKIYKKLTEEDKEDWHTFLKISRYLKEISLEEFHREDLEFIIETLKTYRHKNISIELCENINKLEEIQYLRNINKKNKKNKIVIHLKYSDEYLETNIMRQISLNTLKLCGFFLIIMLIGTIAYISIGNYNAMQEVSKIQEEVAKKIEKSDELDITTIPEETEEFKIKNKYIASLLAINKDVVGYLKVNNTNVDYPVVIGQDNKYYLKKNLYNEDDKNGWIFMDFRNSDKILNDNTIIYGHNMYYSGVMFGTLHRVLNASWYNNEENLIIQFDTMYESMQWRIYSIYTIPKTSDYLKVSFQDEQAKQDFINMTKNRSIKNFNTDITTSDHILTLSTCTGDNSRLVIHAKLLQPIQTNNQ